MFCLGSCGIVVERFRAESRHSQDRLHRTVRRCTYTLTVN